MTRRLEAQSAQSQGSRSEVLRLNGAPTETIDMNVEIDATDQLEVGDGLTRTVGIYPQLSALEMLLYPKSAQVVLNSTLLAAGITEIVPPTAPLTLLVWGSKRVLPVRLSSFSITEEEYDPSLNPIRAKVSLGVRVLNYNDFSINHPGFAVFLSHQVVKEAMATVGGVATVSGAVPSFELGL
jgi:hypothetical protein